MNAQNWEIKLILCQTRRRDFKLFVNPPLFLNLNILFLSLRFLKCLPPTLEWISIFAILLLCILSWKRKKGRMLIPTLPYRIFINFTSLSFRWDDIENWLKNGVLCKNFSMLHWGYLRRISLNRLTGHVPIFDLISSCTTSHKTIQ